VAKNPHRRITDDGILRATSRSLQRLGQEAAEANWTITAIQTGAYTARIGELVRVDYSGGANTVTLPVIGKVNEGRHVVVKNVTSATNVITIAAAGTDTIDGAATAAISSPFGVVVMVSDGDGNWNII